MIQTWRILSGKDRVSAGIWFDMQVDRRRELATTTRHADGHHAIRPTKFKNEERGYFFSNGVVREYNALPAHVKKATIINMFKNLLDEYRGTAYWNSSRTS